MATAHIIYVFPYVFHQYKAGPLKSLAQKEAHEKPRGSAVAQTKDPWITESHTSPLSQTRPKGLCVEGLNPLPHNTAF